jgi:hypothetical protein
MMKESCDLLSLVKGLAGKQGFSDLSVISMGEGKECKIFLCVDCAGYSQIS